MSSPTDSDHFKSLLLEAVQLEPAERAAWIDEHCPADVRDRLQALLQAHDGVPTFLAEADEEGGAGETPGALIGRYKLLQQIGEGGFGTVWMAEQQEPVRRKVALKIIKLGMDTRQVVARFEAERQALALMDHPNIAKVLDGGATESGRPFFVMELVRGVPMTTYCDEAKLATRDRLTLFVEVCHAIQHAHQKGIIHRDIKPSNVLVTLHDGRPVPMVIDFGIAKATSGSLTEKTLFTEFRQFLGTPQYMSPEQTAISSLDVDTRADIYSLGVLLYELLTGTTPFDPATLREAAYEELLRVIREVDPPRPSTRVSTVCKDCVTIASARATEPGALERLMRGDLDWIVLKALEKERTRRYESAAAFAEDVRRHLAYEPVAARPPSSAYRLRKFARRNRVAVVAGVLVAGALIGGTGAATFGLLRARADRDHARDAEALAQEEAENARAAEAHALEEARAAEAINAFYDEMLVAIDPLRLRHRSAFSPAESPPLRTAPGLARDVSVAEMLRGASDAVETSFAGRPDLEAKVRETIGVTLLGLGLPEEAATELDTALRLYTELDGADDPAALRAELLAGVAASESGDNARAEELVRDAHDRMVRVHGPESPRTLHAASILGNVITQRGAYTDARPLLEATLAAQRRVLSSEHRDTVATLTNLANVYLWQTDGEGAEPYVREAVAIGRRTLDPDDIVRVQAELDLAIVHEFRLEFDSARELLEPMLERLQRIAGDHHIAVHTAEMHLARSLPEDDETLPERERLLRRAVGGMTALQVDSPGLQVARHDLALLLFSREQFDEAIEIATDAVETGLRIDGPDHYRTQQAMTFLRDGLQRAGRFEEAEESYREFVHYREAIYGPDAIATCSALGSLTRFLRSCGKLDEARATWQRVIDLRRRLRERPDAPRSAHYAYAALLLNPWAPGMRDPEQALAILEPTIERDSYPGLQALEHMVLLCRLVGRDEDAVYWAERQLAQSAQDADKGRFDALLAHAELLLDCPARELRDAEAAREFALLALDADPNDSAALRVLGTACLAVGREDEAHDAFDRRLRLMVPIATGPDATAEQVEAWVWALVTAPFEDLRDAAALEQGIELLAPLVGQDESRLGTLGAALHRVGRFEEALETLSEADLLNRFRGETYPPALDGLPMAMCLAELGRTDAARSMLAASEPPLDEPGLEFEHELRRLWDEARGVVGGAGE